MVAQGGDTEEWSVMRAPEASRALPQTSTARTCKAATLARAPDLCRPLRAALGFV